MHLFHPKRPRGVFRCAHAFLYEAVSIGLSIGLSVTSRHAFAKTAIMGQIHQEIEKVINVSEESMKSALDSQGQGLQLRIVDLGTKANNSHPIFIQNSSNFYAEIINLMLQFYLQLWKEYLQGQRTNQLH